MPREILYLHTVKNLMEAAFEQVELWIVKFGKLAIECSSNLGFLGLVESEDYNILGCNSKQF